MLSIAVQLATLIASEPATEVKRAVPEMKHVRRCYEGAVGEQPRPTGEAAASRGGLVSAC
jgi:hypothetical protein